MIEWLKPVVDLFAWAVAVGLLVKYRDKGLLRRIWTVQVPIQELAQERCDREIGRRLVTP